MIHGCAGRFGSEIKLEYERDEDFRKPDLLANNPGTAIILTCLRISVHNIEAAIFYQNSLSFPTVPINYFQIHRTLSLSIGVQLCPIISFEF